MKKRDIAGYLNIDRKTLYNWQKNRPNLYNTVMKGLAVDEVIKELEDTLDRLKKIQKGELSDEVCDKRKL